MASTATREAAHRREATPIADRAFAILREEAVRARKDSDGFAQGMFDIGRESRLQFVEMSEKDPVAFAIGCRAAPRLVQEHRQGFKPIRDLFPDRMRDIDEWK